MSSLDLRVPPVLVTLITATAMWAAAQVVPSAHVGRPSRLVVAALLGGTGVGVLLAAVREFRRVRTTLHPQKPESTSHVVQSGIYGYSRNPMYLGMLLVLMAWGAWLANVASVVLAAAFIPYLNRFQIEPEERAMARNFGAGYAEYLRTVRRWL